MGSRKASSSLRMSKEDFSKMPGASGPFGFWDPAGIARDLTEQEFNKVQESEIKVIIIIIIIVIIIIIIIIIIIHSFCYK